MEVNDYVRTKEGNIYKIAKLGYNNETFWSDTDDGWFAMYKSSPNIIDLIEEHDILKIEERKGVYTICEVEVFKEPYEEYTFLGVRIDNRPIARKLYELNIKSIVTKEQFESMEYKVKE